MPSIPDDADPSITLICSVCETEKSITEYYRKYPGYLMSWCKKCHGDRGKARQKANLPLLAEQMRKRRAENPEKSRESSKAYRERNLDKVKSREKVYRDSEAGTLQRTATREANRDEISTYKKSWRLANSETVKAKDAAYREANRDEIYARKREWIAANPEAFAVICAKAKHRRRSRQAESECTLTTDEWKEILRIQENRCGRCRKPFNGSRKPHKDHIVPLSKGGGLTAKNSQGLCAKCNNEKFLDDTDYRGLLPGFLD
jgi:5-methylcytosine-specific restriction endonuclease McrA